jgi:terpene synthase-like protein
MEPIVIPEIYCPFPSLISPHLEQVREHALEWVKRFRLIQSETALRHFLACDIAGFTCRNHAGADLEALYICCDLYSWLFLCDDQLDQRALGRQPEYVRVFQDHLFSVLQNPDFSLASSWEPVALALYDVWQRAVQLTSPVWQQRFSHHLAELFAAACLEAEDRAHKHIRNVQDYIKIRRVDSAVYSQFDMIELAGHVEIPTEIYEGPSLGAILQDAVDIICWTNDVYSLQKELVHGEISNLVLSIQHEQGCSLQEAVNQACTMVETRTRRFQELVQQFSGSPAEGDQDVHAFLASVEILLRGNLDWSRETGRYTWVEDLESGQSNSYLEEIMPALE